LGISLGRLGKLYLSEVMVCSEDFENINIKMDDYALNQASKFK